MITGAQEDEASKLSKAASNPSVNTKIIAMEGILNGDNYNSNIKKWKPLLLKYFRISNILLSGIITCTIFIVLITLDIFFSCKIKSNNIKFTIPLTDNITKTKYNNNTTAKVNILICDTPGHGCGCDSNGFKAFSEFIIAEFNASNLLYLCDFIIKVNCHSFIFFLLFLI